MVNLFDVYIDWIVVFLLNNYVPEGERNFKQKEEYEISKKKYDDIVRKQEQLLRGEYKYE